MVKCFVTHLWEINTIASAAESRLIVKIFVEDSFCNIIIVFEFHVSEIYENHQRLRLSCMWEICRVVLYWFSKYASPYTLSVAVKLRAVLTTYSFQFLCCALSRIMSQHVRMSDTSIAEDVCNVVALTFFYEQYTVGCGNIVEMFITVKYHSKFLTVLLNEGVRGGVSLCAP